MTRFGEAAGAALAEIGAAVAAIDAREAEALAAAILSARRIVVHGAGREGLMMRALAMRLAHLGCDAHVAGDATVPPVGPGDLVLVAAGPGDLPTVEALVLRAAVAGARTACVTARPAGAVPGRSDMLLVIPARTMAEDRARPGLLPMGSVFEGAMFVAFELLVLRLRDLLGETAETMRARHTNLE